MVMNMKDNLNGLSLDDQMRILSLEGLLVDGAFCRVKPIVVFVGKNPSVTLLIPYYRK